MTYIMQKINSNFMHVKYRKSQPETCQAWLNFSTVYSYNVTLHGQNIFNLLLRLKFLFYKKDSSNDLVV